MPYDGTAASGMPIGQLARGAAVVPEQSGASVGRMRIRKAKKKGGKRRKKAAGSPKFGTPAFRAKYGAKARKALRSGKRRTKNGSRRKRRSR